MAKCNSCGAEITWRRTVTGKASPMELAADGTWVIVSGVMRTARNSNEQPRYRSHFASCKDARAWRKAKTLVRR